jgi:N-methylhydantoinase B
VAPSSQRRAVVDPVTTEVIRNQFISAAEEMKFNLMRSAYNPVVFENCDFAVGVFDAEANMIAQAPGLPVFLGTLRENVKVITEDIGGLDKFRPGDLYMMNDPYAGGTHLLDVTCVVPVFDHDEVIGFSVAKMHWLDVGGKDPGSWSNDSLSIYHEGIRFHSVKLYDAGQLVKPVMEIIKYNVRVSESVLGDLRAQIAACRTGERRFKTILEKYGRETVLAAKEQFMNHADKMARLALDRIPEGTYKAEGFIDNDSLRLDLKRLPIRVAVTVKGSEMTVDLTGSQEQNEGPINCGYATTVSAIRVGFKCVTTPWVPINEGSFRALKVIIPENSMFNAKYPAPCCQFGMHLMTLMDTILKALAPALPGKIPAGHYCDLGVILLSGIDPRNAQEYIHIDSSSGGWGASEGIDGENCLIAIIDGDSKNYPVELVEHKFPLRLLQFCLYEDSGGPGRFRGGLGHIRDFQILSNTSWCLTTVDRHDYKPWGLFGGQDGAVNDAIFRPGMQGEKEVRKVTNFPLKSGEILSIRSGGGGGFGYPWQRDPTKVLEDVLDGYVSLANARTSYKVAIVRKGSSFKIDSPATERLRRNLNKGRKTASLLLH